MANLGDYINATRQFVRDNISGPNISGQFYSDAQVIQWINKARTDIIRDTFCTRNLALVTLNLGQEQYRYQSVLGALQTQGLPAASILWVIGIGLNWTSSLRFSLNRTSWAQFTAYYRSIPTFQSFPVVYCEYAQSVYVAPVPNQTYTAEFDCVWLPSLLVNTTDVDAALYDPWIDLVPIMAASWLKWYEQSWEESEMLKQRYKMELYDKLSARPSFSVPSEYDNVDFQ